MNLPIYIDKILIAAVVFFTTIFSSFAQTGQIRGSVYDKDDGEPVIFTNVYLKGTTIGASTDVNGFYVISKIPEGNYILQVTAIGYDTLQMNVSVSKNDLITRNLYLQKHTYLLETVNISAEKEERITETRISVLTISPKEIERLPSVGGQADFAQYLQVLPGVIFTGDQGGQLYVRGGSPIQNKVLLDGMRIYNPFHSIGLFSVFETDLIRNADVYTGGFNAEYSGAISSIMDLSLRDGNKKRHSGKLQASTFGANALLEGPLKKMKEGSPAAITYVLSVKGSYLEQTAPILYPYADSLPFNYLDIYGKVTISANSGSRFSLFGFRYDDNVNNYMGKVDFGWTAFGGGFNFVFIPENISALIAGHVAVSKYETTMNEKTYQSPLRNSDIFSVIAGFDFNYYLGKSDIKWGLEMSAGNTEYNYINFLGQNAGFPRDDNTEMGAYIKYKGIFGKFIVEPGLRLQWYASLATGSPEPRIALKYNITPNFRLKASGGMYSQNLIAATSDRDVINLFYGFLASIENIPDQFKGETITSSLQKANHVVVGSEWDIGRIVTLNLEGYYKKFVQLTGINRNKMYETSNTSQPEYLRSDFIIEDGEAYGMDFSAKVTYKKWYFWAAYSLAYVDRRDEIQIYNPHYDRRHNLNLLGSYKWGKADDWEASARWNFGSGFPFTKAAGFFEKLNFGSVADDYVHENGELAVIYGKLYGGRLPAYHRLDINVTKTFFLGQNTSLDVDLGITNVYNHDNIFYYNLIEKIQVNQLPIMPTVALCFRF